MTATQYVLAVVGLGHHRGASTTCFNRVLPRPRCARCTCARRGTTPVVCLALGQPAHPRVDRSEGRLAAFAPIASSTLSRSGICPGPGYGLLMDGLADGIRPRRRNDHLYYISASTLVPLLRRLRPRGPGGAHLDRRESATGSRSPRSPSRCSSHSLSRSGQGRSWSSPSTPLPAPRPRAFTSS